MKLLISGGSGMVGKNFINHPNSKLHQILSPSSTELNLLDPIGIDKYLKEHKPDIIIHAAGLVGGIQANIANPIAFLVSNIDMGKNLILAAKDNKIPKLINLASSCMYPRHAKNPLNEELILQGELEPTNEGYALAKIVCTRLCEYISNSEKQFMYKTLIPCNLFGAYDKFDPDNSHMIPAVIRKIDSAYRNQHEYVEIWGDGTARREFMHVDDLIDFIYYACDNLAAMPQNINVGLGYDSSINDYYKIIADVIGYEGTFIHDLTKPVGMKQKVVDVSRMKAFGWTPKIGLLEGIEKTLAYYKTI